MISTPSQSPTQSSLTRSQSFSSTSSPSVIYPLATYGPYPNVYSPFSTRSGPPSPSPFAVGYPHSSSNGASSNSSLLIKHPPSQSQSSSPRLSLLGSSPSSRPISIMAKRNGGSEESTDDTERAGASSSVAVAGSSSSTSPTSVQPIISTSSQTSLPAAVNTERVPSGTGSTSTTTNSGGASGTKASKKGKAVQWLDHHLNSQAAHAKQQEKELTQNLQYPTLAPIPPAAFMNSAPIAVPGLGVGTLLPPQSQSMPLVSQTVETAEQSTHHNSELEGAKGREPLRETKESLEGSASTAAVDRGRDPREFRRLTSQRRQSSPSPHVLDEKGLDPNPFNELTAALERHQSQTSQQGPSDRMPTRSIASASLSPAGSTFTVRGPPVPSLQPPAPGPRIHYFPPRPVPAPGTMTKISLPPLQTATENHPLQELTHHGAETSQSKSPDSPTKRVLPAVPRSAEAMTKPIAKIRGIRDIDDPSGNLHLSRVSGVDTPATNTTAESSPDSAMRTAMLPIVPGEDLPPPLLGDNNTGGGRLARVRDLWTNLRQRTSMRRTHDVPGAMIYEGENAGLPSRGRILGESMGVGDVYDYDADDNADEGIGKIWRRTSRSRKQGEGEVDVQPEDVEAYAKSQARKIVRAHTRVSRKARSKKNGRQAGKYTVTEGEDTDDEDTRKKSRRHSLFHPWGGAGDDRRKTKSKDYGNAEIDRMGGYTTGESDVEGSSLHSSIMSPPSGGVLGALLALYNAQNEGVFDSAPPSGASTPAIQEEVLSAPRAPSETTKDKLDKYASVHTMHESGEGSSSSGNAIPSPISPPSGERLSDEFRANATSKQSIISSARKLLGLGTHRPPQSRNAGGVFGSLIASTGNISGAAAPVPSTVAPNVDRPGFNLTRYGYKEEKPSSEEEVNSHPGPGHRPGAKSLSHIELKSVGTWGNTNVGGSALERISTVPTGPGSFMLESHPPSNSEPASPGSPSSQRHPHAMTHTPVSAYIPAPVDYFSPQHSHTEATPKPQDGRSKGQRSHSKTLSASFSDLVTPGGTPFPSIAKRAKWTGVLKDFPGTHLYAGGKSGRSTPATTPGSTTTASDRGEWDAWIEKEGREERERREKRERDKKERKKRKRAELFITRHVAQIIQRQEFICKLARSMMMFGGPAHRLAPQVQATARVLDLELSCMYLPDVMLISFEDPNTGTSLIKFIRQGSVLNLGKLTEGYMIYWKVIHDELSVSNASAALDKLMRRRPHYKWWHLLLIGGACSAAICTVSFSGSFIDAVAVFPLGAILVGIQQLSARNELYSNVFEITIATLFSFLCGCLAATKRFCYSAIASSSIVLILPGFIVLSGGLEILSRNIVAGSVRLCYAVVYCLFLAFGLAMGAEAFQEITGAPITNLQDTSCTYTHLADGPWWQQSPSKLWAFMTVPLFSIVLSMRNHQPLFSREMLICVMISCIGWVVTYFVGLKFANQSDFASAVGAFAIGMISNVAGRFLNGNAFTIMITGILFQVPSGLGNNGLLVFVSQQTDDSENSSEAYLSGFQTSLQLISVAIGLTIGLGISLFLSHPIPSRRRAGGVFSL